MSSTPFLRIKATLLDQEAPHTPHAGLDLDQQEAQALTLLLNRIGHAQVQPLAGDQLEAHLMIAALDKLRTALHRAYDAEFPLPAA
ncbi:hypothetical protein [Aquipseudomonas alcaligenes]|uniref:Uncharacterized protein n=1 Tax=Aquipseudomonas alcaligenes TaxID=43263 RepID=A0A1N6XA39_AQUAC|nr:hypothetical protein [Pseudomonas alcaligenes]SIQ99208.1 hypothetical protein SAMN05878282_11250 [Pseudomonas alcaligenes]